MMIFQRPPMTLNAAFTGHSKACVRFMVI